MYSTVIQLVHIMALQETWSLLNGIATLRSIDANFEWMGILTRKLTQLENGEAGPILVGMWQLCSALARKSR